MDGAMSVVRSPRPKWAMVVKCSMTRGSKSRVRRREEVRDRRRLKEKVAMIPTLWRLIREGMRAGKPKTRFGGSRRRSPILLVGSGEVDIDLPFWSCRQRQVPPTLEKRLMFLGGSPCSELRRADILVLEMCNAMGDLRP